MKWFQNLLVGLLFFGALAIVGHFTILSESSPFAKRGILMIAFFDNADGIKEGARVNVLGVPSGKVVAVDLISVDSNYARVKDDSPERVSQRVAVTIELQKPILMYENYVVAIINESILSGKMVAINPGFSFDPKEKQNFDKINVFSISVKETEDKKTTALNEEFRRREIFSGGDETASFTELNGKTSGDPIAEIAELIEENRKNVKNTVDNLADITDKINKGKGTLGQLVNDDDLHENANTLIKDAEVVVKELRESLEDTREQAPVTSFVRAALTAF